MAKLLLFFAEKYEQLFYSKSYSHFYSKNINVFENTLAKTVYDFVINEFVQLRMLWTTGPRIHMYLKT